MTGNEILLFISKESATYSYTRRQVELAYKDVFGQDAKAEFKVIDIEDKPQLAELHNIEALPTIIIGDKRIVGTATRKTLVTCMRSSARCEGIGF